MKRFYFLLISFLTLSFIVIAQVKMFVHQSNGNIVEILASRVDSISLSFPSKEEPDDPDVPVEPVFYTISFDANGGTGTFSSEELEENKTYVIPSNVFIREGYKFIGWNTKSNGTGISYTEGQNIIINNDLTLYAQWKKIIKYYTLSFNANGGNGSMNSIELAEGIIFTISSNPFTRTDYEFVGWNTKADGTGTSYTEGQTISLTENTTLYAQWEKFNITGTANGHDYVDLGLPSGTKWATCNVGADSPEEYGDYFAWGETESKSTYNWSTYKWCNGSYVTMTKYCTSSSYGTVDNKTTLDLSDDAAYVNWGGDWCMPTIAVRKELRDTNYTTWTWTTQNGVKGYKVTSNINGNSIFLPAAGYRDRSSLYSAGSGGYYWCSSLSTDNLYNAYNWYFDSGRVFSYHEYRYCGYSVRPVLRVGFTISFDANGGTGTMSAMFYEKGETKVLTANKFTRTGYLFNGWNTKPDGSGASYAAGENLTLTTDLTLYAQWKKIIKYYTLSFNANGGNGSMNSIELAEGIIFTIPSNPFTRTDYEFVGWNTKADGSGASYTAGESLTLTTDLTLYAQWKEIIKYYTLSFNANGGNGSMNSIELEEGKNFTIPSNPFTRTDYEFIGWNTKADGSGASYTAGESLTLTTDLTLYAQWKEIIKYYTLSFNANGGSGSMNSIELEEGKNFTIPSNPFTRTGYIFKGWNTKADGTGTSYTTEGQTISLTENTTLYAQWEKFNITGTDNEHDYVDLGLPSGTLWATCNVGADSPEEYGDYFAWGETEPKDTYNWSTYKWMTEGMSDWYGVNKYTFADGQTSGVWYSSYSGFIGDNKTTLDISDDAAYVNWGSSWRMPTKAEQDELRNTSYTTWTWTTQNGVNGYKVTSKTNGNSIFLPAAGYRFDSRLYGAGSYSYYWSGSLDTGSSDYACYLSFSSDGVGWGSDNRNFGRSVRPVLRDVEFTFTIMFDGNGGEGTMPAIDGQHDDRVKIPASTFTRDGYYFVGWNTKANGTGTSYSADESILLTADLTLYAQWEKLVDTETDTANGHDYVDLGLPSGTKWATCNVGADSPEKYGEYFAWGETEPKDTYNRSTYYSGFIGDNKTALDLSDDAAYVNWGSSWRMPTKAEQDELRNTSYTTWTWTTQNGVKGYKVTSKTNGNSIFLPAAGYRRDSNLYAEGSYGYYWSRSLRTYNSYYAYNLRFYSDDVHSYSDERYDGQSVRPVVLRDGEFTFTIMFDGNGGEGTMPAIDGQHDDIVKIPASTFTRDRYYFVGWNTKANGTGTAYTEGQTISLTENTTLYAQWKFNIAGTANGHDYVDLGLPSAVLWATCNVGADSPEEYGDHFAWGETEPKSYCTWGTYKWMTEGMSAWYGVNKYTFDDGQGTAVWYSSFGGFKGDNKTMLELSDDAANANWGGRWRMPTKGEQDELRNTNYTTWTWTTQNGVEGYKVTSKKNGNSIFLPAAGYRDDSSDLLHAGSRGSYWSSSLSTLNSNNACFLSFRSGYEYSVYSGYNLRFYVRSVRPVLRIK